MLPARPLLQRLEQPQQQPRPRHDGRDQHVFVVGVCALAAETETVQGRTTKERQ